MTREFPEMYEVHQQFDTTAVKDAAAAIDKEFRDRKKSLQDRIHPGERVAVAVGSRGICDLALLVSTVVENLRALGLHPFIFPAMGSHGGATAQGQREVLNGLGVTEQSVGAPVVSSMEVQSLGKTESGAEAFLARDVLEADHLMLINRVKPHTAFRSSVESGLCKMLAVGCGKHKGASEMHKYSLASSIVPAAKKIMSEISVLGGLALVENSNEQIWTLRLVFPEEFARADEELLQEARILLPKIPFSELDILLVDEIGKNISGAGMDPNVIGSWRRDAGERVPDYRTLIVLDISQESHGNALGIGMADLTTKKVVAKIDYDVTYTNALTTGIWASSRIPVALEDDRQAVETALAFIPEDKPLRMARIINTLKLKRFWVTKALLPELQALGGVDIDNVPKRLSFDHQGRIEPF
ncbi:MAG: nickel-dependent lactate racemase [Desulfohalobiaceae bacterium]|nr:nickel-dependent lactate racemase [Desulfohalobiaceae bacterium]